MIVSIPKSGDTNNVDNYRGTAISSCLSKLLNKIQNERLEQYVEASGKWSKHHCGFTEDHRTDDKLLVLRTIYSSYFSKRSKPVFLAFVDFKKYFDSINRNMLFYKLQRLGGTGNFYSLLKEMYN